MSSINYKVIFKGSKTSEKNKSSLTFQNILLKKPIKVPLKLILELKKMSENNPNIITFQNIEEVLKIRNDSLDFKFHYYFVLLYTFKTDGKKSGFLIGNTKGLGDILIGIWPFNKKFKEKSFFENYVEEFENLIKNPHKYKNITLIIG